MGPSVWWCGTLRYRNNSWFPQSADKTPRRTTLFAATEYFLQRLVTIHVIAAGASLERTAARKEAEKWDPETRVSTSIETAHATRDDDTWTSGQRRNASVQVHVLGVLWAAVCHNHRVH